MDTRRFAMITGGVVASYPLTHRDVCLSNPNVSFPENASAELFSPFGFSVVVPAPKPRNTIDFVAEEGTPEFIDGVWRQVWTLRGTTEEERKRLSEDLCGEARHKRDSLLRETDWMALSDVVLTPEMAAYRQALRDITAHVNFPYLLEEDWPVKP